MDASTPLLAHEAPRAHRYAARLILVCEGLERLAYYGLVGNLVLYLQQSPISWPEQTAYLAAAIVSGITFFIGVFAGWLSDTLGRRSYHIIAGYLIYLVGLAIMTTLGYKTQLGSYNPAGDWYLVCVGLLLSAVGAGVVRINIAPFGGDQVVQDGIPRAIMFFNYFYMAINGGCIVAYSALLISEQVNYFAGFLAMTALVVLSLLIFCFGKYHSFFIEKRAGRELFTLIFSMCKNAIYVKRTRRQMAHLSQHLIDYAKVEIGGDYPNQQVEDVKNFGKAFVTFLCLFPYWICYGLMTNTLFLLQANLASSQALPTVENLTCDSHACEEHCTIEPINVFPNSTISVAPLLECFAVVSIVVCVPVALALYKYLASINVQVTTHRRVTVGFLLATLSLLMATVFEAIRVSPGGLMPETPDSPNVNNLSVFWMVPQYCFKGLSEVFAVIAGLEYAYIMAPAAMQGFMMGLFWMFEGLGSFVGSSLHQVLLEGYGCLYFHNDLRNIYICCCVSLAIWTAVFAFFAHRLPLGLEKVTIYNKEDANGNQVPSSMNG